MDKSWAYIVLTITLGLAGWWRWGGQNVAEEMRPYYDVQDREAKEKQWQDKQREHFRGFQEEMDRQVERWTHKNRQRLEDLGLSGSIDEED